MKISPKAVETYVGWAESYYNPALAYHNWGHAEEVMEEALDLLNSGGRWTRHVNRPLLQVAAAWHDAGFDHDERLAFESPEHYSAHLMRQRLKGELTARQLREVEETILATHFGHARHTMAGIALHYGDVANMASEHYQHFYDHNIWLWKESGYPEWQDWRANTVRVMAATAAEAVTELPLIGIRDGLYVSAIQQNMTAISTEPEPCR